MKRTLPFLLLVSLWLAGNAFGASSNQGIAGNWLGTLDAGAAKLRVLFKISQAPGGALTATMDSLDQGARDILVDTVSLQEGKLRLEVKLVQGVYEGTLDDTGMKITGTWRQGPAALPLTLERSKGLGQGKEPASSAATGAEPLAKAFVMLLAKEDFEKATGYFDATMKAALSVGQLKGVWAGLVKEAGAFQQLEGTRAERFQQYRIVYVGCRFQQKSCTAKVVLDQADKVSGLFFLPGEAASKYQPPAYVQRSLFREKEVVIGSGEWKLPGTLSMPTGIGPFPALVLVHGSGPQDRDETIGPNKPFRDLAGGLASQGIAVLRYEKRTKAHALKCAASLEGFTVQEETIADALEAVSLLRKTEEIDGKKVFVLGHSLGGMLAPRLGASAPDIAGLIILAGAARPLEDLMLEQTLYQVSLGGASSAEAKKQVEEIKRQVAAVKKLAAESSSKELLLNAPASYWLDLKGYNPPAAAKTLKQPLLILQGEQDCQVNPKADFEEWCKALSERKNVKLRAYPGLNHLFIEVQGKSTGAEYQLSGHVAEIVVRDIAAWIKLH